MNHNINANKSQNKMVYRKKSDITTQESQSSGLLGSDIKQSKINDNAMAKSYQQNKQSYRQRSQSNQKLNSQLRYKRKESHQDSNQKDLQRDLAVNSQQELLSGMIYDRETQSYQIDKVFLQVGTRQKAHNHGQARENFHNSQKCYQNGKQDRGFIGTSQTRQRDSQQSQARNHLTYQVKNPRQIESNRILNAQHSQTTLIHQQTQYHQYGLVQQQTQFKIKNGSNVNQETQDSKPFCRIVQNPETYYVFSLEERDLQHTTNIVENYQASQINPCKGNQINEISDSSNDQVKNPQGCDQSREQIGIDLFKYGTNMNINENCKTEEDQQQQIHCPLDFQSHDKQEIFDENFNTPTTMTESPNSERNSHLDNQKSRNLGNIIKVLSKKFQSKTTQSKKKLKLILKKENIKFANAAHAESSILKKNSSETQIRKIINIQVNDNPSLENQTMNNLGMDTNQSYKKQKKRRNTDQMTNSNSNNERYFANIQEKYFEKAKCLKAPKITVIPMPL